MTPPRPSSFVRVLAAVAIVATAAPARGADDLAAWEQAIVEHPDDARGYEGYGLAAIAARRFDDAIERLRAGVARVPGFKRGYYLLAVAHRSRSDWSEAASYYRVCLALDQQVNDSRYGLGRALAELGDKPGAIEALSRYVLDETDPDKAAFVARARGELERLRRDVSPRNPSAALDPAALRAEATRLQRAGRLEPAVAAWRRLVAAAPPDSLAQNELGSSLFGLKRYDEAIEAFQVAVAIDRGNAVAWFNLANALRKVGRSAEAVPAAERFVELEPGDPDGWYGLAQSREGSADGRGALEAYRHYLSIERRPDKRALQAKAERAVAALRFRLPAEGASSDSGSLESDDVLPLGAAGPHLRDLRDPFESPGGVTGDLDDLLNPFTPRRTPARAARGEAEDEADGAARVREYAAALAAYRRALTAHADRVSARYEKGVGLAIAGRVREAGAAWDSISLDDEALVNARRTLERLRSRLR